MWTLLADQKDAPVMQIRPQEHITEKTAVGQTLDITVPHYQEEVVDIAQITPQEFVWNHTAKQYVDMTVPPFEAETAKVGQTTPQELRRTDEREHEGCPAARPKFSVDTSKLEQMQDNDLQRQAQEHAQKLEEKHGPLNGAVEQREMKLRRNRSFAMGAQPSLESRLRDELRQVLEA